MKVSSIMGFVSASILGVAMMGGVAVAEPEDACPWPLELPTVLTTNAIVDNGIYRNMGNITKVICHAGEGGVTFTGALMLESSPDVYILAVHTGEGAGFITSDPLALSKFQLHQCINDLRKLCQNSGFAFPNIKE